MEEIIQKEIISTQCVPELMFAVYPEPRWQQVTEYMLAQRVPVFVLVYRFEEKMEEGKYLYKFAGARQK